MNIAKQQLINKLEAKKLERDQLVQKSKEAGVSICLFNINHEIRILTVAVEVIL